MSRELKLYRYIEVSLYRNSRYNDIAAKYRYTGVKGVKETETKRIIE